MVKLTKTHLIDHLTKAFPGLSKSSAGLYADQVFGFVRDETAKGAKVAIAGFGTFEERKRAPRMGRNPKSGETIQIGETKSLHFKASKSAA